MWLLSTSRAELKFFPSPESVPKPGYAILSHRWSEEEHTFQDLHRIYEHCKTSGDNPRNVVGAKIREFCKLAERAGCAWAWADMCCIDKTSSAELSEAINAMYHYYEASGVCYVYLEDVPEPRRFSAFSRPLFIGEGGENLFLRSQWHRRGWTLQELIAPRLVIFLSSSWKTLGTKADLAVDIETATNIPVGVLRNLQKVADVSVAQRMSWAADRETTRIEDRAYSLLGIFGIYMSPLYGEGAHSFRRLQEEIMRKYQDTTLFAWGVQHTALIPRDVDDLLFKRSLFADSPDDFRHCGGISYVPGLDRDIGSKHPMSFTSTPYGVFARVPLAHVYGVTLMNLSWTLTVTFRGTIQPHKTPTQPLFVPLIPSDHHSEGAIGHYLIAGTKDSRLVRLAPSEVAHAWCMVEIYIGTSPVELECSPGPTNRFVEELQMYNRSLLTPFHFHLRRSKKILGLVKQSASLEVGAWNGSLSLIVDRHSGGMEAHITLGTCSRGMSNDRADVVHWAHAQCTFQQRNSYHKDRFWDHDCSTDHIASWERRDLVYVKAYTSRMKNMYLKLEFTRHEFCSEIMVLQSVRSSLQSVTSSLIRRAHNLPDLHSILMNA